MSPPAEDWSTITDANERRKAQNRVAQRNYRSRQKLRVEIAESILYDLPPHIRSAVGSKGRRWLTTALQSESQELRELSAALTSQQAPGVSDRDEQGNEITQLSAYPMLADTAADSGDGDIADLDLASFTPGDDWIDPQMDWTAAMSLTGESSTSHSQARTVSPEASIPTPAPVPAPGTTAPQARPHSRPALTADVTPPATVAPLDVTNGIKHRDSFYPVRSSLESKTPVMTAISRGRLDIARLLIGSGAQIDVPDMHGKTNLHYAVQRGDIRMARSLLELGANVTTTDAAGMTALLMAVEGDNESMVKLLLEWCQEKDRNAGSTGDQGLLHRCINYKDGKNMTPVHLCVVMERVEILKTLLHYGADVTIGCE